MIRSNRLIPPRAESIPACSWRASTRRRLIYSVYRGAIPQDIQLLIPRPPRQIFRKRKVAAGAATLRAPALAAR